MQKEDKVYHKLDVRPGILPDFLDSEVSGLVYQLEEVPKLWLKGLFDLVMTRRSYSH